MGSIPIKKPYYIETLQTHCKNEVQGQARVLKY